MSVRNTHSHISTYFANYILHMSSKIVCVLRDFFFQCSPEMEVMTKTNSVRSVAYLGRVSPWRHENIERKKSSSRKWSLSPENGITDLAPIVLPSFVISISTALMASNGYLFTLGNTIKKWALQFLSRQDIKEDLKYFTEK